jgi:hypothetical protein
MTRSLLVGKRQVSLDLVLDGLVVGGVLLPVLFLGLGFQETLGVGKGKPNDQVPGFEPEEVVFLGLLDMRDNFFGSSHSALEWLKGITLSLYHPEAKKNYGSVYPRNFSLGHRWHLTCAEPGEGYALFGFLIDHVGLKPRGSAFDSLGAMGNSEESCRRRGGLSFRGAHVSCEHSYHADRWRCNEDGRVLFYGLLYLPW